MTLYEFKQIDNLTGMMGIVNQYGVFIDNHITYKERCNLYSVDMFFVEVVYDHINNSIMTINSFKSGHLLDKYSNLNPDIL